MDYNKKAISNLKDFSMANTTQDLNNPIIKNREFTVNSETIVSFVIEKIISLAITDAKRNEIEAEIPSKCFSYVTNIINNFIKTEYLPYDRDDRYILLPNLKKKDNNQNSYSNKALGHMAILNTDHVNMNPNNNNINNNNDIAENNSNLHNNFLNKSLSANEEIIKQLQNDNSSVDDDTNYNKISNEDHNTENDFLKTNDNVSNFNLEENLGYFFDNRIFGVNDWTICDEPVTQF